MKAKFIITLFLALLFNVLVGNAIASVTGFNPFVCTALLFSLSFIPGLIPTGASAMSLLSEIWTGELLKKFRLTIAGSFLERIASRNELVKNNTVHLVDIGADPDVLINNTTYPIPSNFRDDTDVPIGLDKFDSTNTNISDDELQALPYDKEGSVISQHNEVLEEKILTKAAHSL
ncbi:MAG: hypothetical protein Q7U54_07885, partial [Bacteroidales bacterium]|nr:hypothetical protein [Bacteroidales bacterium]